MFGIDFRMHFLLEACSSIDSTKVFSPEVQKEVILNMTADRFQRRIDAKKGKNRSNIYVEKIIKRPVFKAQNL